MTRSGVFISQREGVPVLDAAFDAEPVVDRGVIEDWTDALLEWLDLPPAQRVWGSGVCVLGTLDPAAAANTVRFALRCRTSLTRMLGERAFAGLSSDVVILAFRGQDDYYAYLDAFFGEGEHGASAGVMVHELYPHIALWGANGWQFFPTLAHEMLHLALSGQAKPLWLEEGLAQLFEIDMGSMDPDAMLSRVDDIQDCKAFWRDHGVDPFWEGWTFQESGELQKHSYLLAELLARGLVSSHGRRSWFRRSKPTRFETFVWSASREDAGESAAQSVLGLSLSDLAEGFLGQEA